MPNAAIVPFRPEHAEPWAALNTAWLLEGGFEIEAKDRKVIADPQGSILDPGGHIFMVERDGQAIGCCALMAMDDGGYEVAKMTVTPAARGLGLSRRLLEACEATAQAARAPRLYLETSSTLTVAGRLYRSFGFVALPPPAYALCAGRCLHGEAAVGLLLRQVLLVEPGHSPDDGQQGP